jgi:hypothetical protein
MTDLGFLAGVLQELSPVVSLFQLALYTSPQKVSVFSYSILWTFLHVVVCISCEKADSAQLESNVKNGAYILL